MGFVLWVGEFKPPRKLYAPADTFSFILFTRGGSRIGGFRSILHSQTRNSCQRFDRDFVTTFRIVAHDFTRHDSVRQCGLRFSL
jgi:hypothetical protein